MKVVFIVLLLSTVHIPENSIYLVSIQFLEIQY